MSLETSIRLATCISFTIVALTSLTLPQACESKPTSTGNAHATPCGGCTGIQSLLGSVRTSAELTQLLKNGENEPNNPKHHLALGFYYLQNGLYHAALEEFETVERLNSDEPLSIIGQIRAHQEMKQLRDADQLISVGLKHFPSNSTFPILRYYSIVEQGSKTAADNYISSFAKNDTIPDLTVFYASILASNKDYQHSLQLCNRLLNKNPNFAPALFAKGYALTKLGRTNQLTDTISSAFDQLPYSPTLCRILLKYHLSKLKYEKALEPALALLALSKPDPIEFEQSKLVVIQLFAKNKIEQFEKITDRVTKRLQNEETASAFQHSIAELYNGLGRTNLALSHFSKSLSLSQPTLNEYLEVARYAETKALDWKEALSNYQNAYLLAKTDSTRKPLLQIINRLQVLIKFANNDIAWQLKSFLTKGYTQVVSPVLLIADLLHLRPTTSDRNVSSSTSIKTGSL